MTSQNNVTTSGRNRSQTWHGQQIGAVYSEKNFTMDDSCSISPEMVTGAKKPWSRRNAWGSLSYADLISKAIESAPGKRMTLAQIYDWMVQNVPYFYDKGNTNSSAGWKNSIRHNLSLHRRFRRVSNDDTGKSSWWMLNEDGASVGGSSGRRKLPSISTPVKAANEDKYSSNHEKSPSLIRSGNNIDWPGISEVSISEQSAVSVSCSAAMLSSSELSEKQQTSVFVKSDVNGESTVNQVSRFFPVTALTWLPFGAEQLSSIGDTESQINSESGPSSYPLPLMPISEIFEPIDSSASCDIQLVELQSPSLYGDYHFQTTSNQSTQLLGIADQSSMAKDSSVNWFPSPCSSSQRTIANILSANGMNADRLQSGRHQQSQQPGCSLLRQMLAQTHHENARMHGISAGDGVANSWNWMQSDSDSKSNSVSRSEPPAIEIPASVCLESSVGLVPIREIKEENVSLLSKTAIIVEPLEDFSSDDPNYTSKWEDEIKYGDAWNVNLNVVLGVHEDVPNNNNNNFGKAC